MRLLDRLIAKRAIVGDCWVFTGAVTSNGYGSMRHEGRTQYTHRLAYIEFMGPIPDEMQLDHLCRVRACFNPAHLEPVPQAENLHRSPLAWQTNASKTHCPKGHPYTPENTYIVRQPRRGGGQYESRACITCRQARYHERKSS